MDRCEETGEWNWHCNINSASEQELFDAGFDTVDYAEDPISEMQWIEFLINRAKEYNLDLEVIAFGLKAMKSDSSLTPAQALKIGYEEWIK